MATLHRLRVQQAKKVLQLHQDDIRFRIRQAKEREERVSTERGVLAQDAKTIWTGKPVLFLQGEPITALPKTREFWHQIDFTTLSTLQLRAVADLLSIDPSGRKPQVLARLQDWVNSPAIERQKRTIEAQELRAEQLEASGSVFSFGNNALGQLGLGDRKERTAPTEIRALKGKRIVKLCTGYDSDFAFALSQDGLVYGWGGGGKGPLGVPKRETEALRVEEKLDESFLFPQVVQKLKGEDVVSIACARAGGHVAATTEGGQCLTWGEGNYGQLGINTDLTSEQVPTDVTALSDSIVVDVDVGNSHTVAVTDAGKVYAWGSCWGGQLGVGVTKQEGVADKRLQMCFPKPTLVKLNRVTILKVACGAVHTAIISSQGDLYTFGCGNGGRLGHGDNQDAIQPRLVDTLKEERVLVVCCSNWHTLCISASRSRRIESDSPAGWVYSFGSGINGQLGLGKQRAASYPTRIPGLLNVKMKCTDVHASSYHSCALGADGSVFTWGRNSSGCLGRYTPEIESAEPGIVDGVKGWGFGPASSVSCGHEFTLILSAPWKGISRTDYNEIDALNRKKKAVSKITARITAKPVNIPNIEQREDDEIILGTRGRRSSLERTCPGFELAPSTIQNQYRCKHCKLTRRLHDII